MVVKIFLKCDSACWNPDAVVILHALQAQRAPVCDREPYFGLEVGRLTRVRF